MPAPQPFDRPTGAIATSSPAHDLKNLLAVILGVCESLSEGLDPGSESGQLARVGLLAAERAGQLAHQVQSQAPPRPAQVDLVAQPEGQGRTVLVVEDDPELLRLMTAAFARAGFKAYSARNGRLGLQLLRALEPDLMVTDIVMPEKEGIATIIEAKQAAPNTGVIAISGGGQYGRTGDFLQWAEELGADEVMAKPFPMPQLLTVARVVLERRGLSAASSAAS
jgi:CheY-like chemotaxis protein